MNKKLKNKTVINVFISKIEFKTNTKKDKTQIKKINTRTDCYTL